MGNLKEKLSQYFADLGVDIYGFCDLTSFDENLRSSLPYGISFGIAVDKEIIRKIPNGPFMDYVEAYSTITDRLDEISNILADYLKELGYSSVAQDRAFVSEQIAKNKNDTDNLYGKALMPHKTVAACSGLGFITKSALVVTEKFGSAVRFGSVLTDAPLDAIKHEYSCLCGSCTICQDNCPGKAINGVLWTKETPREELIVFENCQKAMRERGKRIDVNTGGGTCGMCIAMCPHTIRYLNS